MTESASLAGKRVAILVEDEFEDRELTGPLDALRAAGADVTIVGATKGGSYRGKRGDATVTSDLAAGDARMRDFDALIIPGGHAPDKMRLRHAMVDLTRDAMEAGKPVAAICHGPQLLISANALRGRTLDLLAVDRHRRQERGRSLRRQAGGRGRQPDYLAETRRRSGLQRRDHPRALAAPGFVTGWFEHADVVSALGRTGITVGLKADTTSVILAEKERPALPRAGRGAAAHRRP